MRNTRSLISGMVGALVVVTASALWAQARDSTLSLNPDGSIRVVYRTVDSVLNVDSAIARNALTVRPHATATVTRNPPAGIYTLDGKPHPTITGPGNCNGEDGEGCDWVNWHPMVDVPPQCAGEHRCPLLVLSNAPYQEIFPLADKYGMIVAILDWRPYFYDGAAFDKDFQVVLRTFAVDPDRIALLGRCSTGPATVNLAAANPTLFSRVLVGTGHTGYPRPKAPNQTTEYFIASGLYEGSAVFRDIQRLRELGYPVTYSLQFRGHSHEHEEYDFMGHWLQESWAHPDPATRPKPYTFSDPPLLSLEILAQVEAFTRRFRQEPDSIKTVARQALVREVLIPLGQQRFSSLMADMAALAARYPSVAAAFKASGLTPQNYDVYRAAIASTLAYENAVKQLDWSAAKLVRISADSLAAFLGVEPRSVFAKNLKFRSDHPDEFSISSTSLLP